MQIKLNKQSAFDLYRSIVCFFLTNIGGIFFIYHYNQYFQNFQMIMNTDNKNSINYTENIIPQYDWIMTQYYFSTFLIADFD